MPSNPELKVIHGELLRLLNVFHQICIEHDIKYSVHGGTMLGAVREHGFIPWDDDVDITLTRDEYEKLIPILKNSFDGKEYCVDDFSQRIPKIIMHRENKPAVWLDLFIYDYISEKKIGMKIKKLITVFLLGFTKTQQEMKETKNGKHKGAKYYLLLPCYLLGKLFPYYTKLKLFRWVSIHVLTGKKEYVYRSNDQYIGILKALPKKVISEYKLLDFEGIKVMVFKDYKAVLTSIYGEDYMTPRKVIGKGHDFTRKRISSKEGEEKL